MMGCSITKNIEKFLLHKALAGYAACHQENGLFMYAVIEKESSRVIVAAGFNVRTSIESVELLYPFV
ncbi:hypothetical protein Q73_15770 [Bacillus coahuilensis m2-6]|uniref:hypothetical protein n=2 Tax=Bacillus coahuilensis TaxID=408580 RepID=UPI000185079E|nr:hypothetical protein [Bacillus coahuilensis]KUP04334.1 hypothetical protein Q73_15770 [Bacillus coahuilensis m2-6]